MNFLPDGEWGTKECRNEGVLKFMEQRHYLSLARQHGEEELTEKITRGNRFFVRSTNMVRSTDPTIKILLSHYGRHYKRGEPGSLADLIFIIVFVRSTMSKEIVKICAEEQTPWLHVEQGKVAEQSNKYADAMFLALGGRVVFRSVQPMSSRALAPRRGWGEFVSELVSFAARFGDLAAIWSGGVKVVEQMPQAIWKIPGFGGKGFRMKEIVFDLAEMTRAEHPGMEEVLLDFGVVGPVIRRTLNFINNRRWFDNEQDRSPATKEIYVAELLEFRDYAHDHTNVIELKELNLLGVQFALCEAS